MDFETIAAMKNEEERVSAIYELFDEDNRLKRSQGARIEFLTTMHYLQSLHPHPSSILDCGAGTGVYSIPLAQQGHRVTAVELATRNVEVFKENIKRGQVNVELFQGNALDLSRFADETFDTVLLFGPMYHLETPADQHRAMDEALRVLKPNGNLLISFINNDFIPMTESVYNHEWFTNEDYNHENFKVVDFPFVFHRLEDIRTLFTEHKLVVDKEIAADGLSELLDTTISAMSPEAYQQYINYHLYFCEQKERLVATNHFLVITRKL